MQTNSLGHVMAKRMIGLQVELAALEVQRDLMRGVLEQIVKMDGASPEALVAMQTLQRVEALQNQSLLDAVAVELTRQ